MSFDEKFHAIISLCSWAPELIESIEDMSLRYYVHSDMFSIFIPAIV